MEMIINPTGQARCLYGEVIDLSSLGRLTIARASHVEPDSRGLWWADLSPIGGPRLGPCEQRSQALKMEQQWLLTYWLPSRRRESMLMIRVTEQEFHGLIAALRFYQQKVLAEQAHCPRWIRHLAKNGGQNTPLNSTGIDKLCEPINEEH